VWPRGAAVTKTSTLAYVPLGWMVLEDLGISMALAFGSIFNCDPALPAIVVMETAFSTNLTGPDNVSPNLVVSVGGSTAPLPWVTLNYNVRTSLVKPQN